LVRIDAVEPGRTPSLDEVRDAVERDLLVRRREEANDALYQGLRERYRVVWEGVSESGAGDGAGMP
jgi:hypothetical protein